MILYKPKGTSFRVSKGQMHFRNCCKMLFHKMSPSEVVNKGLNQSAKEQNSINDNESTKTDAQTNQ